MHVFTVATSITEQLDVLKNLSAVAWWLTSGERGKFFPTLPTRGK